MTPTERAAHIVQARQAANRRQTLLAKALAVVNSHKTPPKGYPSDSGEYGDPKNHKYPIDKEHIRAAVSYFNHPDEREKGGYSEEEWSAIGHRIASAANRLIGEGHSYKGGKISHEASHSEAAPTDHFVGTQAFAHTEDPALLSVPVNVLLNGVPYTVPAHIVVSGLGVTVNVPSTLPTTTTAEPASKSAPEPTPEPTALAVAADDAMASRLFASARSFLGGEGTSHAASAAGNDG